jgi:transposase-like protein
VTLLDMRAKRASARPDGGARTKLTEAEARRLLAEWERAGGPLAPWCRDHGVPSDTLYRWRDRLAGTGRTESPRLVEVVAASVPEVPSAARCDSLIIVSPFLKCR